MITLAKKRDEYARNTRALQTELARAYQSATTSRDYPGYELAPYTGRPGSLDHLLLPSRTGKTLHYRSLASIKSIRSEPMPA